MTDCCQRNFRFFLTSSSKKSPTSKVEDELRPPIDKLKIILYNVTNKKYDERVIFSIACTTKSNNQAVGMEIMKGE